MFEGEVKKKKKWTNMREIKEFKVRENVRVEGDEKILQYLC